MIKSLIDIMGGASAPHDMPIPNESNAINRDAIIFVIIAMSILLLLGMGAYFLFRDKNKSQQKKTPKSYHYIDAEDEEEHK